jgi:hypothetical protein
MATNGNTAIVYLLMVWNSTTHMAESGIRTLQVWNISVSNRLGGAGLDDIWVSRRATRNDPWGAPENLGRRASKDTEWTTPVNIEAPVNTEFAEEFPMISADGSMLYFNSDRPGGFGDGSLAGADRSDCWP